VLVLIMRTTTWKIELDGCIVWNAHNTVLGEEALLIYIVPVCYVKQVGMEKPSDIIISLRKLIMISLGFSIPTCFT